MTVITRIDLTREEVHVLLEIMELPSMVGFEPLSTDDENDDLFDLALRVLMTRGVIHIQDEDQFLVDEKVAEIIGICAGPDVMMITDVNTQTFSVSTMFAIDLKPGTFVSHQVLNEIHTFEVYDDIKNVAEKAVASLFIPNEIAPVSLMPLHLRNETIEKIDDAFDYGHQAIMKILQLDSGDVISQQRFADVLVNCTYHMSFAVLRSISDDVYAFSIIAVDSLCFSITNNQDADNSWVTVESISTHDIRHRVHSLCLTQL